MESKKVITNNITGESLEDYVSYYFGHFFKYIFRPMHKRDIGIDGLLELTKKKTKNVVSGTGIFFTCQVKGQKYKKEDIDKLDNFEVHLDARDAKYLLNTNLPAIILLCIYDGINNPMILWQTLDFKMQKEIQKTETKEKEFVRIIFNKKHHAINIDNDDMLLNALKDEWERANHIIQLKNDLKEDYIMNNIIDFHKYITAVRLHVKKLATSTTSSIDIDNFKVKYLSKQAAEIVLEDLNAFQTLMNSKVK